MTGFAKVMNSCSLPRRRLKFLFLSADKFPPFRVDLSVLFAEEMVKRGHEIHWILQSEEKCDRSFRTMWSGCPVWVGSTDMGTGRFNRLRKRVLDILHALRMFRLIPQNGYDFVQVKDRFIIALFALLAARLNGTSLFYWLSYPFPESDLYAVKDGSARYPLIYLFRGHLTRCLLYRIIMPLADHVFVQSEQMRQDITAQGIPFEKLTAVPMGISMEGGIPRPTSQVRMRAGLEPDGPTILYLGTLIRVRRLDFLLRVLRLVLLELPEAKLYLVGDGEDPGDTGFLREEAVRLNVSQSVVFTGFLPREEAMEWVARADVCVSPFYPTPILSSTSPTKLIEYMAMGKAVVANDHPEQRLVIEESGAGICVPYEEEAFARAIEEVLRDPARAVEMGRKGREYVIQNRAYSRIAEKLDECYVRVLGSRA